MKPPATATVEGRPAERRLGWRWCVAILLVALAYRALCFAAIASNPPFVHPVVDAETPHLILAKRIAAGDLWGQDPDDVFKPALYPYVLAVVFRSVGVSVVAAQWLQYLLGAVSAVMIAVLADRLLGRRVGMIAGLLAALYAPFVFFESQLLTPCWSIALNLAFLLLLLPRAGPVSAWRWILAGLCLGLSAEMRPDVLAPGGLVALLVLGRQAAGSWRHAVTRASWLAAGAAIAIAPFVVRNARLTGEFIPVASYSGVNFYIGNRLDADGTSTVAVGLPWENLLASIPQELVTRPNATSRMFVRRTWGEIGADPGRFVVRFGRKALALVTAREIRNNICFHFIQSQAWPFRLPFVQFAVVFPLAAVGAVALTRDRRSGARDTLLLAALWCLGYALAGVVYFVNARYRLPAVPILLLPAGYAVVRAVDAIRAGDRRWLALAAVVVLVAGATCWPRWLGDPRADWWQDHINSGNARRTAGDLRGAEQDFRRSLRVRETADGHYLVAKMLWQFGRPAEAMPHLAAALEEFPESPTLLLHAAQGRLMAGDTAGAREHAQRIVELARIRNFSPKRRDVAMAHLMLADLDPDHAAASREAAWRVDPLATAEFMLAQKQDLDVVVATFARASRARPWDRQAAVGHGRALLAAGQPAAAAAELDRARQLDPSDKPLLLDLATAQAAAGHPQDALRTLATLVAGLPPGPLRTAAESLRARLRAAP